MGPIWFEIRDLVFQITERLVICIYRSYSFVLFFDIVGNQLGQVSWGALDDVVMGGVSESTFVVDSTGGERGGPTGIFRGHGFFLLLANFP